MTHASRPLRVTWLGHGAERTGPPVYLLRILEGLRAHPEIEPSVVLLEGGPLRSDLAALAPVRVLTDERPTGVARVAAAARSRTGLAARRPATGPAGTSAAPPDVVVVNTAGSIRAVDALPERPRRLVTHVHELATGLDYWLDPAWRQRGLDDADAIWVVADAVADHLADHHGVDRSRMRTHRGVLPDDAFAPADPAALADRRLALGVGPDELLLGASGTLDWRKAPDHLIEVVGQAEQLGLGPAHVVWIGGDGSGPWGRLLLDAARRSGLGDRVHHVAEADRPDRWFGALDVFVLPSREDAYPLVCLEAAAAGVPIVTYESGGAPELIADGGGASVPYPDATAFAAALVRLGTDPVERRRQGELARAAARRHTAAHALPSLVADLHQVAGR